MSHQEVSNSGDEILRQTARTFRRLFADEPRQPTLGWCAGPHADLDGDVHVSLTTVALLLERLTESTREDTWRNIRNDLRQVMLAQLLGPQMGGSGRSPSPAQTQLTN